MDRPRIAIWRIFRFGCVGAAATATHAVILWTLVESGHMRASIATLFGFFGAFSVSYLGHFYISFQSREPHRLALPRYALAALLGAGLNWSIFAIVTDWFAQNYWIAFLLTLVIVPPSVYFISKNLAFDPNQDS